ncbi:PAS domain S-box protein [bacterium]|nr:PAS domain S-box protein [bacterium]
MKKSLIFLIGGTTLSILDIVFSIIIHHFYMVHVIIWFAIGGIIALILAQEHKKLKQSRKKYKNLIEGIQEGVIVVDKEENITFVNQSVIKISGYSKKELLAINLKNLTNDEGFQKIIKQTKIRKSGKQSRYEIPLITKDGQKKPLWFLLIR